MKTNLKNIPVIILMGLIKYSPIVTTISGKLSGGKLYKGRSGNIISTKVKPVNRRTTSQLTKRASLKFWAGEWKAIGGLGQRLYMASAANIIKKNRVGDSHTMAGFNLFITEGCRLDFAQPNTVHSVIYPTAAIPTNNGNLANPVAIGGTTQTFVIDMPLVSTGDVLVLSATAGLSKGKSFIKGKSHPFLWVSAGPAALAESIYTAYSNEFGAIATGSRIHLSAEYISLAGSKVSKYPSGAPVTVDVS